MGHSSVNARANEDPALVSMKPYEVGWLCRIEPRNLQKDLKGMRVGAEAVSWYQEEIDKYFEAMAQIREELAESGTETGGDGQPAGEDKLEAFSRAFLHA